MNINLFQWLMEQDMPQQQQSNQMQSPQPSGGQGQMQPPQDMQGMPPEEEMPDVSQDPQVPDRPEEKEIKSFQDWKKHYFELSIRGDVNKMIDAIGEVRDADLSAPDRKFVEDNIQICLLRQDANIDRASKEIRKLIKQELDRSNPATSVMQHITRTLEAYPQLNNIFIKLCGLYALKGDLHRKFVAALVGGVQVGGGGDREDIIYADREYSINISTRFYTEFDEIALGGWCPKEDDPQKFLAEPEIQRLEEGSPEEKQVLRNRIILESIAERFKNRSFLMHLTDPSTGNIAAIGWDISECLRDGYKDGKFVVRPKKGIDHAAMFNMSGELVPLNELCVFYARQMQGTTMQGTVAKEEVPFMERKDGKLYLTADANTIDEVAGSATAFFLKEIPYSGNPSDLRAIMRCVPSAVENLLRRC